MNFHDQSQEDQKVAKLNLKRVLGHLIESKEELFKSNDIILWRPVYKKAKLDTVFSTFGDRNFDIGINEFAAGRCARDCESIWRRQEDVQGSSDTAQFETEQIYTERPVATSEYHPIKMQNGALLGVLANYSAGGFLKESIRDELIGYCFAALLPLEYAINAEFRDRGLEDSLLALEVGRAAEDRFHDIKEALFGAIGSLSAAKAQAKALPRATKYIKVVEGQLRKASDLADKYVREAKDPERIENEVVSLNRLLSAAVGDFEDRVHFRSGRNRRSIDIRLDCCDDEVIILGDAERLFRALGNILANAEYWVVRSVSGLTRINVSLSVDKPGIAAIKVMDTGPGIVDIRQAMVKGYSARGGTGFGLAIAAKVLKLHGGELHVNSQVPDWTAITMRLPVESIGKQ